MGAFGALIVIGLFVAAYVLIKDGVTETRVMHNADKMIKENERDLKNRINKEYGNGKDLIK